MAQRKRQTVHRGTITSISASESMKSEKDPNPLSTALAVYIAKLAPPPKSTFKGGYVLCGTTPYHIIKTDDPHSVDFHIGFCNDKPFRTVCSETNGEHMQDKYLPQGLDRSNLNDLAHDLRDIIHEMESVNKSGEDTSGIERVRVGIWKLSTVLKMVRFGAEEYYCKQNEEKLFSWENAGKPKGKGSMYAVVHLEMERGDTA